MARFVLTVEQESGLVLLKQDGAIQAEPVPVATALAASGSAQLADTTLLGASTTLATVTVTPNASGKFRIMGFMTINNGDGDNSHVATATIFRVAGPPPGNGNQTFQTILPGGFGGVFVLMTTDAFTLGTPVTFGLEGSDNTGNLSALGGGSNSTWLDVQELG